MNKRSYRRFTTDEKRMILTEVQQPGVTLSEVCRKHSGPVANASCQIRGSCCWWGPLAPVLRRGRSGGAR